MELSGAELREAAVKALNVDRDFNRRTGLSLSYDRLPEFMVDEPLLVRGLAQILMGDVSLAAFPDWFKGVDRVMVGNHIPLSLVIFLCLAVITGLLLHKTVFGRWIYALGTNETAACYSGVPVDLSKIYVFVLSGFASALAGIMVVSRLNVAMGRSLTLSLPCCLSERISLEGVALFLVAVLRTGMGIANIKIENQLAVVGTILVFTIVVSNLTSKWQSES